jgi:hypothetical protein
MSSNKHARQARRAARRQAFAQRQADAIRQAQELAQFEDERVKDFEDQMSGAAQASWDYWQSVWSDVEAERNGTLPTPANFAPFALNLHQHELVEQAVTDWFDAQRTTEERNLQQGLDELTFLIDIFCGGSDMTGTQMRRLAQLAELETHRCVLLGDGNKAEWYESVRQAAAAQPFGFIAQIAMRQ